MPAPPPPAHRIEACLFIIVASMAFEFFAEPITGDLADAHGWLTAARAAAPLPDPTR